METYPQNAEPPPRVYVLGEDTAAVVETLRERDISCREYGSATTFLEESDKGASGCVVVCSRFSDERGLELHNQLVSAGRCLPVVVVSDRTDVPSAVRLMQGGVASVLEKDCQPEELVGAVSRALKLSETRRWVRKDFAIISAAVEQLSTREEAVLQAIVAGHPNKAIARSHDVSVRTIEGDRAKIVDKFGALSTCEVVGKYAQYNLLVEMGYPTRELQAAVTGAI